jgi:gluconolactonase
LLKVCITLALAGALACPLPATAAPAAVMKTARDSKIIRLNSAMDELVAPSAKIEQLASGFVFLEGPMWREGGIWMSDLRGNKMYKVTPNGDVKLMLDHAGGLASFPSGANGGSNAMVTAKDGSVLMEQHGARRIVRLDNALKITPYLESYDGERFNSPNDMVFSQDGALWFTDPPYGFADPANPNKNLDRDPAKKLPYDAVFRFKGGKLAPVITDLPRPNGIGFSPDGKKLYISNTEDTPMILRYDVAADGSLSNRVIFADLSKAAGIGVPDGLKLDSKGDLWATGPGGIRVFSPDGEILGQIQLPEAAANLAWGGDDLKTLFIMGSTSIYTLRVRVAGERPLYFLK